MKRRVVLCILLLFFLVPSFLAAQKAGEKDDLSLFEIDRLIRRTEYDEALRQLNIYIEKNPEKFDNAQTRIKRIMNARNQYSILAERLIKLIQNDPGNNKEIYEITAQLEKFEKHPSDQNLQFIADLKKSAEFNYFRALFLEIQTQTAEFSHAGDYFAAVEKAKEGFWLYRDNFYDQWEDNTELTESVNKTLADLDNLLTLYEDKSFSTKLNNAVNDFIRAVNQDQYEQALARFRDVENQFRAFAELRAAIIKDGKELQNQFALVKELDKDQTDASFLPFMFRFVFGVDSVEDSGILGAVNCQWNALAGKMNQAVYSVLLKKYGRYESFVDNLLVSEVEKYSRLDNSVLDIYKLADASTAGQGPLLVNPYENYYELCSYVENLSRESLRITNVLTELRSLVKVQQGSSSTSELFDSNNKLTQLAGQRESQELAAFSWARQRPEDFEGLSLLYESTLNSVFEEMNLALIDSWKKITDYYIGDSQNIYNSAYAYYDSADRYRSGFFTKIPDSILTELKNDISKSITYQDSFNADPEMDFGITYSYPDISLSVSRYTKSLAEKGITTLDDYSFVIDENFKGNPQQNENEDIKLLVESASTELKNYRDNLLALISDTNQQQTLAQRQITAAQLAKNEADLRFTEAENALRAEDFDMARKKLQDALSKYDESLNFANDEVLRANTDYKLQRLGESIAKTENEIVVREVRDLKNRAKDAYFNGRFDDAEKYLNQAKIRWAVTNVDQDEEITNLLNFVNTAISMKTGREILPSAPQYPEMSQLLNISYQYFDEGSRKIGEGDRAGGEKDLALALDSIQKLQYVYPLNQEASILTLRINRLLDPAKFKNEFAQKIEMAKLMCQNKDTRQEGYANLLDYYELDPSYKGLKDLIYQVEIDIGIRAKPVSNSGASRARSLVAEAQRIFNSAGNDTVKLQNALSKVDEALTLVSDNEAAMALKDKITTKIGGNTSTVLSTEDERLYQLAIQRLQNNNVVGANAIVEQLLKKPQNSNSQKIKELKNKIEARS